MPKNKSKTESRCKVLAHIYSWYEMRFEYTPEQQPNVKVAVNDVIMNKVPPFGMMSRLRVKKIDNIKGGRKIVTCVPHGIIFDSEEIYEHEWRKHE